MFETTEDGERTNRPCIINLRNVPSESLSLCDELTASLLGGDISGLGVFAIRRHGLSPIIAATDSAVDCPELALGMSWRLTFFINKLLTEKRL